MDGTKSEMDKKKREMNETKRETSETKREMNGTECEMEAWDADERKQVHLSLSIPRLRTPWNRSEKLLYKRDGLCYFIAIIFPLKSLKA